MGEVFLRLRPAYGTVADDGAEVTGDGVCPFSVGGWPEDLPDTARVAYDLPAIVAHLDAFLDRFFRTSQFKRSAVPNGPKVSPGGALSPRGDWRAPSDGTAAAWRADLARWSLEDR